MTFPRWGPAADRCLESVDVVGGHERTLPDKSSGVGVHRVGDRKVASSQVRLRGQHDPTRASTWEDSSFQERAAHWGDFAGVARRLVEDVSDVLVTPAVNYIDVAPTLDPRTTGCLRRYRFARELP